jgi:hypothetical protein
VKCMIAVGELMEFLLVYPWCLYTLSYGGCSWLYCVNGTIPRYLEAHSGHLESRQYICGGYFARGHCAIKEPQGWGEWDKRSYSAHVGRDIVRPRI